MSMSEPEFFYQTPYKYKYDGNLQFSCSCDYCVYGKLWGFIDHTLGLGSNPNSSRHTKTDKAIDALLGYIPRVVTGSSTFLRDSLPPWWGSPHMTTLLKATLIQKGFKCD